MQTTNFKGVNYLIRELMIVRGSKVDEPQSILVSTESLEKALMPDGAQFVNDEAANIDSTIYFFVPDEILEQTDDEIVAYIAEQEDEPDEDAQMKPYSDAMDIYSMIYLSILSDDAKADGISTNIKCQYKAADDTGKKIINDLLIALCGWSMETLLKAEAAHINDAALIGKYQ